MQTPPEFNPLEIPVAKSISTAGTKDLQHRLILVGKFGFALVLFGSVVLAFAIGSAPGDQSLAMLLSLFFLVIAQVPAWGVLLFFRFCATVLELLDD